MNEYLVSIAASGKPFVGPTRTIAKSIRVTADTPVQAGELVLDRFVSGTSWGFSSARATVINAKTHEVEATIAVPSPKPFGIPRRETAGHWQVATPDSVAPIAS